MTPHIRHLITVLEDNGARDVYVQMGGKHPRLMFVYDGVKQFYVVPGTSSDRRARINATTDLRRMTGGRDVRKSKRAKRRRIQVIESLSAPTLTVKPDPFETLKGHDRYAAALQHRATVAWQAWWSECLSTAEARMR